MNRKNHLIAVLVIFLFFNFQGSIYSPQDKKINWCEVEDNVLSEGWKDGLHGAMDMEFVPNSDFLIISSWPDDPYGSAMILTFEKSGTEIFIRESVELPLGGMVDYSGSTQCGIGLAIREIGGEIQEFVGRCLSSVTQVVEMYTFFNGEIDVESRVEVLNISSQIEFPSFQHHIGEIEFDENGLLWVFNGFNNVIDGPQNNSSLHGSVISIDVDMDGQIEGNSDNPGMRGDRSWNDLVYAKGLRMPWKATLDSSGHWWIGDVGGSGVERIFRMEQSGLNFGYPNRNYEDANCEGCEIAWIGIERSDPKYTTEDAESFSSPYAAVYVGSQIPISDSIDQDLWGGIIFGDFTRGWMRVLDTSTNNTSTHLSHLRGVVDMEVEDGQLFALTTGTQVSEEGRAPGVWVGTSDQCLENSEAAAVILNLLFAATVILAIWLISIPFSERRSGSEK